MGSKLLPPTLLSLISELTRFPGIGEKSALRMILFMLRKDKELLRVIGSAFLEAYQRTSICERCFNIAEDTLCEICKDPRREEGILCVVEDAGDLISIERSGQFRGRYHVLAGLVSPMDNKRFEDLTINELKNSIINYKISELILALNPTVEGEATVLYIKEFLKGTGVKITRIAHGIPMGSDIEYLDEFTMAVALQGRKEIE